MIKLFGFHILRYNDTLYGKTIFLFQRKSVLLKLILSWKNCVFVLYSLLRLNRASEFHLKWPILFLFCFPSYLKLQRTHLHWFFELHHWYLLFRIHCCLYYSLLWVWLCCFFMFGSFFFYYGDENKMEFCSGNATSLLMTP